MSPAIDETWRGEAEVEEPSVATALAGEAAKALVTSSHCGAFQPQDEPMQKESAVAQPEGARGLGRPLHLLRGATLLMEQRGFDIGGHHYWYRHPWMSSDIIFLLQHGARPHERALSYSEKNGIWYFGPDYPVAVREAAMQKKN